MPDTITFSPPLILRVPGYGEVEYYEAAQDSPVYVFTSQGSRAERTFIVAWAQRDTFVKGILGFPTIQYTSGMEDRAFSSYVGRVVPNALPDIFEPIGSDSRGRVPGNWLYATQVSKMVGLEPTGLLGEDGVAEYNWAVVTVLYEGLTYKVKTDNELVAESPWLNAGSWSGEPNPAPLGLPWEFFLERYVTRTAKPTAEFLNLGRGKMYWVIPDADPVIPFAEATSILVPGVEYVYTWHQVPFLPRAAKLHIGKVNRDWFDPDNEGRFETGGSEFNGFTPGTLLYASCEVKPYRMGSGAFVQDITYRMKYLEAPVTERQPHRGRGHNYFLRWDSTLAKLIYRKVTDNGSEDELGDPFNLAAPQSPSDGQPIYQYADFYELFSFYPADGS